MGLVLLVCFCVSQKWGDYLARSFLATDLLIWFKFPSQLKWCCCHSFRCRADWSHLPTFSTQQHVEENTIHSANCLLKPNHPFLQLDWKSFSQPCAHGMRERETQQLCSVCTPKIRLIFNAYRSQFYNFNKKTNAVKRSLVSIKPIFHQGREILKQEGRKYPQVLSYWVPWCESWGSIQCNSTQLQRNKQGQRGWCCIAGSGPCVLIQQTVMFSQYLTGKGGELSKSTVVLWLQ